MTESTKTEPSPRDWKYTRLRLKALIRTDEAYLVDLGQGKVWVPVAAIRSTRRIDQGIFEIEVREDVIEEKRQEMRRLKEKATGVKGSVLGEVVEVRGVVLKEVEDALLIEFEGKKMFVPRVCFAECEKLPGGDYRFVIQKDFLEFKLRQLESAPAQEAYTTVRVQVLRETDRACLISCQGQEIWFPKREVLRITPLEAEGSYEIVVPSAFWQFKLESGGVY